MGGLIAGAVTVGAVAAGASRVPARRSQATGGSLTVLESSVYIGDWPEGFDPATNLNALANASLMDAIYGEMFQVGPHNVTIDDLASGYKLSNGARTLTIDLRRGVSFSDGTPFDAGAVLFNWRRDLAGVSPASPPWPPKTTMTASGPYAVVLHFTAPDGAAVNQFQSSNVNWIASPTALRKLGKKFAFYPVGAGPFIVVSDVTSNKLVLRRNPRYWQAGHPYLDRLTFLTVASDEAALEAMRAGSGQAYEFMATPQLVSAFRSAGLTVTASPGTVPLDVQLNTLIPPFNNLKAREAMYYATDASAIDQKIYQGTCPLTESFTGPGGLFYEPKVPGYRTYDLAKAQALVKSLGGLTFTMPYGAGLGLGTDVAEALQAMYQAAGMTVTLKPLADLAALIEEYHTGQWQAIPAAIGAWDPAAGIGVAFRLASYGPFTGVKSPQVDRWIIAGQSAVNPAARAKAYAALAKTLSNQAITPFICAATSWDIVKKGVQGPGLTSVTAGFGEGSLVLWQDVSVSG